MVALLDERFEIIIPIPETGACEGWLGDRGKVRDSYVMSVELFRLARQSLAMLSLQVCELQRFEIFKYFLVGVFFSFLCRIKARDT